MNQTSKVILLNIQLVLIFIGILHNFFNTNKYKIYSSPSSEIHSALQTESRIKTADINLFLSTIYTLQSCRNVYGRDRHFDHWTRAENPFLRR